MKTKLKTENINLSEMRRQAEKAKGFGNCQVPRTKLGEICDVLEYVKKICHTQNPQEQAEMLSILKLSFHR